MAVKLRHHKGKWWVFIDHHGKRKAKCIGDNKRAAQQVAEKIQAKIALGQFELQDEKPQVLLFAEYGERWLDTYARVHLKPGTWQEYAQDFRLHLKPAFGNKRLNEITRQDIHDLIATKRESGLAWNSVRNLICPLREMLNHAVEDSVLAVSPASRLGKLNKKPAERHQDINPLTKGKNCGSTWLQHGSTSPAPTPSSSPSPARGYGWEKPSPCSGMPLTGTGGLSKSGTPTVTSVDGYSLPRMEKPAVWI